MQARDLWVMIMLACVATLAALALAARPGIAAGDESDADPDAVAVQSLGSAQAIADHVVPGVTPSGTTINVFDYWVSTRSDIGSINQNDHEHDVTAINKDHVFKFVGGGNVGVNQYVGVGNGPLNFVEDTLVDGYPSIKAGKYRGTDYESTSLAYLFDMSEQDGKAIFPNATGLLQQDSQGYYYYDCTKNYAWLDESTNAFTLYDAAAVRRSTSSKPGQFFPFTPASTVFNENWGKLTDKGVLDNSKSLNHHFGMTMSTKFVQPSDGMVTYNGTTSDMTYSFSGDDDVWVYIDGVLVGDLGGIHDAAGLDIDFHTGDVTVTAGNGKTTKSTLLQCFVNAGKDVSGFNGNTFASGTQHTLNFFYLERGAYASNLSQRYNLYNETASDIYKVDQNGEPLAGASFDLYRADDNYNKGDLIASGTTDANGQLTMTYNSERSGAGDIISFDEEAQKGYTHFVLVETDMPDGYHTPTDEMRLLYVQSKNVNSGTIGGSLVSPDDADGISLQWKNGGYASAKQTVILKDSGARDDGGQPVSSGTMFAVVLKHTGTADGQGNWQAVTGNAIDGYQLVAASEVEGAIAAAQAGSDCTAVFASGPTGLPQATVESLPGSIDEYAHMLADSSQGKYAVAVYHTSASSLAGADASNTHYVDAGYMDRQFACTLYVTNVQNRLWVQKVDDAGKPVSGAQFGLFAASSVTDKGDGTYELVQGATPLDTATTADHEDLYGLEGAACFPLDSDSHTPLTEGVYYLAETKAPDGYEPNATVTRVIVDSEGVWADAGKAGDGVLSMSGPGSLLASLSQFGARSDYDDTLSYVTGTLQSGELGADGKVTWAQGPSTAQGVKPAQSMTMHYANKGAASDERHVLDYAGDDGQLPIIYADTGINRMNITQTPADARNGVDLSGLELNALFTNACGVQYADKRVASLEVTKTVEADDAFDVDADALFSFQLTLPELADGAGYDARVVRKAASAGDPDELVGELTVKNGDVVQLKAGETLMVYGLAEGDAYTVTEVTTTDPSLASSGASSQADAGGASSDVTSASAADGQAGAVAGESAAADSDADADDPTGSAGSDSDDEPSFQAQRVVTGAVTYMPKGFELQRRLKGGVEVTDGAAGAIAGTIAKPAGDKPVTDNELEFVNAYKPVPAVITPEDGCGVGKVLDGRDWEQGDAFSFQLSAGAGVPMPDDPDLEVADDGTQTLKKTLAFDADEPAKAGELVKMFFGSFTYDKPGTYAYEVREVQPAGAEALPGVAYSQAAYTATVTVVDEGGKLAIPDGGVKLVQTADDAGAKLDPAVEIADRLTIFTNTYAAAPAQLATPISGQKTLTGRAWFDGESYDFTLAAADDATRKAVAAGDVTGVVTSATASAPADGATAGFAFGNEQSPVTFAKAGTYRFVVRESAGQASGGMTYDSHQTTVTVVVSDVDENGAHTGALKATVSYDNSAATTEADKAVTDGAAFTNVYHASGTYAGLAATKTMQGKSLAKGDYAFSVTGLTYDGFSTEVDENTASPVYADAQAGVASTLTCADGTPLFARTFTEADLGHVFAYRVSEQHGADGNGYSYDTAYHGDAVVLVEPFTDSNDAGTILAQVSVLKGEKVTALLNGTDASALTGNKIAELMDDPDVYVQQASDGTASLSFVNSYAAKLDYAANGGLTVTKTLAAAGDTVGTPSARTFSATLTAQDTAGEGGTTAQEAADKLGIDATQGETVNFTLNGYGSLTQSLLPSGLTFTQADDGKTFTYALRESVPSPVPGGYAYDDGTYTVAIAVRDNGDGTITATTRLTRTSAAGDVRELGTYQSTTGQAAQAVDVPVTNTYDVTAATIAPAVTKVVAGADATEQFTFVLAAAGGATRAAVDDGYVSGAGMAAPDYEATASTTGTIREGASQKVTFDTLTFKKAGTYTFTVREDGASDQDGGSWTYDTHTATLTVRVVDEGGSLRAVFSDSVGASTLVFSNTYATSTTYGAQGGLQIEKTLANGQLREGQFAFVVEPVNDAARAKLPQTAEIANQGTDASGVSTTSALDGLTFGTADRDQDFTFKISERNDGVNGYTYDDAYYLVTVTPKAHEGGETLYTVTTVEKYDAAGTLVDTQTVSSQDGPQTASVAFANAYRATGELGGDASVKINALKKVLGTAAQEGTYAFDLSIIGNDGTRYLVNQATATVTPGDAGTPIEFEKITFGVGEQASTTTYVDLNNAVQRGLAERTQLADGTTTYVIACELSENLKNLPDGVRPSTASPAYVVTVTITDDGRCHLTPAVSYPTGDAVTFVNYQDKAKTIGTAADPKTDIDGALLGVGDEYVYTINWANTTRDEDGKMVPADVTVTDTLPVGTRFVSATEGGVALNDRDDGTCVVTWNLGQKPAGSYGSVQVCVRITDAAVNVTEGEDGNPVGEVGVVSNAATITVGQHETTTNTTTNYVPGKTAAGGNLFHGNVNLGDEITYTIYYRNTESEAATVTVTDTVPDGTAFVRFDGADADKGTQDGRALTWTIADVPAGAEGTVSFVARVTEDAFGKSTTISNQAQVKVGENNPAVKTNVAEKPVFSADLVVQKFAYAEEDNVTAPDVEFTFRLDLADADGNALTGSYYYFGMLDGSTWSHGYVKSGDEFKLTSNGLLWIYSLPVGARYTLTETDANTGGFVTDEPVQEGVMSEDGLVMAFFENVYKVAPVTVAGTDAFPVAKELKGRAWSDSDAFTVKLAAVGDNAADAPMPEADTLTLTKDAQTGAFGNVTYTKPGTYTYDITETNTGAGDVTYSRARYRVTVTVTDDGQGSLVATHELRKLANDQGETVPTVSQDAKDARFENTGFTPKTIGTKANPTVNIDGQLLSVGGEYTYTVNWVNNATDESGALAPADVTVTDTLPAGTEFVSASAGGTAQGQVVTWQLGSQAAGARGSVTVTVRITSDAVSTDELSNTATVTVGEHKTTTNATTNYVPRKDVSINGSDEPGDGQGVKVGDELTYTVGYRNTGDAATTVTVTDVVPTGTEFVEFTGAGAESGVQSGSNLTWTLRGVQPGAVGTVSFTVRVTEAALAGTGVDNAAAVRVGPNSPACRTNTTHNPTVSVEVPRVTKVLDGERQPGLQAGEFTFGIEVSAAQGSPADGFASPASATATNDADGNVDFGRLSFSKPGTYSVRVHEIVPDDPDPLIGYTTNEYTFDVVVTAAEDGSLAAHVENEQGSSAFHNTYERTSPVKTVERLEDDGSWTKVDGQYVTASSNAWTYDGSWLRYTITWKNDAVDPDTGKACASTVTVRDFWPTGTVLFTDKLAINDEDAGDRATWVEEGDDAGLITWTIDAAAGESGTVSFWVCVMSDAAGTDITNQGTVSVENGSTQQTNVTKNYAPAKEVTGDVYPVNGVARLGDEIEYQISYKNLTTGYADITVTDSVPTGTEFVGFTGDNADAGVHAEDGSLTWTIQGVDPDGEGTVSFRVKVTADAFNNVDPFDPWGTAEPIKNQATVRLGDNPAVSTNPVETTLQTSALSFYKEVEASDGLTAPDAEFTFRIEFYQADTDTGTPILDDEGNLIPIEGAWSYTVYDNDYNLMDEGAASSGATITLKAGWRANFMSMPAGCGYRVTELDRDGNVFTTQDGFTNYLHEGEGFWDSYKNPSSGLLSSGGFELVPFKNIYSAQGTLSGAENLQVTKAIDGRDWREGDAFTFKLAAGNDDTAAAVASGAVALPDNATGITITEGTPNHAAAFGDIAFAAPGTYLFKVTEDQGGSVRDGLAFDDAEKLVSVTVTDNGDGTLAVAVDGGSDELAFTNAFSGPSINTNGMFTKTLLGRGWAEGDAFAFTMRAVDDAPMPADATDGAKTVTVSNAAAKEGQQVPFGFGSITFEAPGTYVYEVSEDSSPMPDGVVKDEHVARLTVVVEANDEGALNVTSTSVVNVGTGDASGAANFTNAFAASKTIGTAEEPTVSVDGQTLSVGGQYTYTISWVNSRYDETSADGSSHVTVTDALPRGMRFVSATEGGSYDADANQVTWDLGTQQFNAQGTVQVTVEITDEAVTKDALTNSAQITLGTHDYWTNSTSNGTFKKEVTNEAGDDVDGQAVKVGDVLTYAIHYSSDKPGTAGSVYITDTIPEGTELTSTYDITGMGSYHPDSRTITWAMTSGSGVVTFKVRVTADALTRDEVTNQATLRIGADGPQIKTNETHNYTASVQVPQLTKVLAGDRPVDLREGEFTFNLAVTPMGDTPADGFTQPGPVTNAADGTVDFGTLSFSKAGTYQVSVTEDASAADPLIRYDGHAYTFTVVVEQGSDGRLTARIAEESLEADKTFTNTWEPAQDKKTVTKADPETGEPVDVDGRLVGVGDELTYTIQWSNDLVDEEGRALASTVTISDEAPAGTEIVMGSASDGGQILGNEVTWKVSAAAGQSGTVSFRVKVLESASEQESLTNEAMVRVGKNQPKYTNEVSNYVAGKTVTDDDGAVSYDADNADIAPLSLEVKVGDVLTYAVSWHNGNSQAARVTITDVIDEGLTVREDTISDGGTYDAATRTITWSFDADAKTGGQVSFKAEVNAKAVKASQTDPITNTADIEVGGDATVSTNVTRVTVDEGDLQVSKTVVGGDENKEFGFVIFLTDAHDDPITGMFDGLQFDQNGRSEVFWLKSGESKLLTGLPAGSRYNVLESEFGGYTPSCENHQGQIVANDTVNVDYVNTYAASPATASTDALFTKGLVGRAWLDSDAFSFTLTPQDGAPMPEGTDPETGAKTVTVTAPQDGSATAEFGFGSITYTLDDLAGAERAEDGSRTRDFTYDVAEVAATAPGMVSDEHHATLTVTLTDDGAGNLTATPTVADGAFTNTFRTGALSGADNLAVTKGLVGRAWHDGDAFTFALTAADKATEAAVADGTVVLPADAAGLTVDAATEGHAAAFGDITFHAPGTYTFTIAEQAGSAGGMMYDRAVKTVTVEVTDEGDGVLAAVASGDVNPAFTNVYVTDPATASTDALFSKAVSGRDWLDSDAFSFTLTPQDGAPMPEGTDPETGAKTVTVMAPEDKTAAQPFGFGSITYTLDDLADVETAADGSRTKTFSYTVAEGEVAATGMTRDAHEAHLTVTLTDDGAGNLTATPAVAGDEGAFTNAYSTHVQLDALANVSLAKVVDNADIAAGQFAFTLTPKGTDADEVAEKLGITTAADAYETPEASRGEVTHVADLFSDAAFTPADDGKVFSFDIEETRTGGTGYTNDTAARTVTVAPTYDASTGVLSVTVTLTKGDQTVGTLTVTSADEPSEAPQTLTALFENGYSATGTVGGEGNVQIEAQKTLHGRRLNAGEFSFVVTDAAGTTVATGTNAAADDAAAGAVTFTPITYTSASLARAEKEGLATRDGNVWTLPYTVSESTAGLPAGVEPVEGAVSFDVTVTLTDNGDGTLTPAVSYPQDACPLPFENVYAGSAEAHATLVAGKRVSGTTLADGDYSVTFADVTNPDVPVEQTVPVKAMSDVDGTFTLPLTYTTADLAGVPYADDGSRTATFTYRISEVGGHRFGITYDGAVYYAQVTLTDDGRGSLTAGEPVYTDADGAELDAAPTFVNVYGDAEFTPWGAKETDAAEGVDLSGVGFSYLVVDDATGATVATGTSGANGQIAFTAIKVSEGEHSYTISEVASGAQGDEQTGITYDATLYRLTLNAQVHEDGSYTFDPVFTNLTTGEQADGTYFHNTYRSTDAQISLSAAKTITAPHTAAGFSFAVTDILSGEVVSTGVSREDGGVTFSPIYYKYDATAADEPVADEPAASDAADAGSTTDGGSTETPAESAPADEPQAPAAPEQPAAGAADEGGAAADEPATDEPATAEPALADEPATEVAAADEPAVGLLAGAFAPSVAIADDEGADAFSADVATQAVRPTSTDLGEHWYVITELNDGQLGVTYDTRYYLVLVNVTDDGLGHMDASVADVVECWTDEAGATQQVDRGADLGSVVFANEYAATQPAEVTLAGTKTLTGRDASEGEFSFTVRDASGATVAGGTSAAAKAGEPGAIGFGSFQVATPGDFVYTVAEDVPSTPAAGVTYDPSTFVVTVHAEDDGDGHIVAEVTSVTKDGQDAGSQGIAFANAYRAETGVSVTLQGTKTLTGRDAKAGEFGFLVTDASGAVVASGTSAAAKAGEAAAVTFTPIGLTEPGEYDYAVTEVNAGKVVDGVTYSSASFAAHVSVTDNLDGTLSAQVTYPNGAVAFTNAYSAPTPGPTPTPTPTPTPGPSPSPSPSDPGSGGDTPGGQGGDTSGGSASGDIPKTGDATAAAAPIACAALGGLALAGAGALAGLRRGRRED